VRAAGPGLSRQNLIRAYREACEIELRAFKPGNISIYGPGHGMDVADFERSAEASAPHLADAALALGEKIFRAIEATRAAVGCNTNLGIVLLAAPLMEACRIRHPGEPLRAALARVLSHTTRDDALRVYEAIRLAAPGGLGEATEQDVREAPTVTLCEAMSIAQGRDRVAFQYAHGYTDVFDFAIPRYHSALSRWGDEAWAAVIVFVGLLKCFPDSHLERKFGTRYTRMVAARMVELEAALLHAASPEETLERFHEVDSEFKACGLNPGTTADLTVACLLAVRLEALMSGC
jgi:triphosphoribosyl-dephospho-CoA synthase